MGIRRLFSKNFAVDFYVGLLMGVFILYLFLRIILKCFHFSNSTTTEESIQDDEDLMETFLELLGMLLNRIKLHQTDVICRIIESFSALIGRLKFGENSQTSTDTYSTKLLQSAYHVERFLKRTLLYNMNPHESTLIDELLVSEIGCCLL